MIDYVLVKAKYRSYLKNVNVKPGELPHGYGCDEYRSKRLKKSKAEKSVPPRRRTWLLKQVVIESNKLRREW